MNSSHIPALILIAIIIVAGALSTYEPSAATDAHVRQLSWEMVKLRRDIKLLYEMLEGDEFAPLD